MCVHWMWTVKMERWPPHQQTDQSLLYVVVFYIETPTVIIELSII